MAGISGNNLGKRDGNQIESKVLNSEIIREIVEKIHQQYNLDFRGYADASLSRRIDHVIKIFGLEGPGELINKVSSEPDFKISLVHEITVGATEMFRDPSFWIALKSDILPALIQKEKIEVWIAGCSTGEEIFSLSIFLKENQLLERTSILSTDLDPIKLDSARKGIFPNTSFVKNSENYVKSNGSKTLDYYCKKQTMTYQMDLNLLQNVTFRQFDLIQESFDRKFDLILCRNVMIYFNQDLQNAFLKKIAKNLKKGAFLGLGLKESITWLKESSRFESLKRIEKIYRLRGNGEEN